MVARSLTNMVTSYRVAYMIPRTFAYMLISYRVTYMIACALTYMFTAYSVRYVIPRTLVHGIIAYRVCYMISCALANLRSVKRSVAVIVNWLTSTEEHQSKQYVQEFLHISVHDSRKVYIMLKGMAWRDAMLYIINDFFIGYLSMYLAFLFLRERWTIPTIIEAF